MSVALVTRNRPESLERTLRSLRAQSLQPYEIVVSDDSDEVQSSVVQELVEKYDGIYVRGPQRGLYANRNHVALCCQGTHVRTMDDDHEFPRDHMEACSAAILNDPESIWIIGEWSPDALPPEDHRQQPPCPGQLHARGFSIRPANPQNCCAISDGATIFPRIIFDKGVRYSEEFKFGAAYLELGDRLCWMGYRIRHLDSTYVIHYYDPLQRSFLNDGINASATFFAMLCHSFIYQPNLNNKLISSVEITRQLLTQGSWKIKAFTRAVKAYKKHKAELGKTIKLKLSQVN